MLFSSYLQQSTAQQRSNSSAETVNLVSPNDTFSLRSSRQLQEPLSSSDNKLCTMQAPGQCSHAIPFTTVTPDDPNPSSPPLPQCANGLVAAMMTALGLHGAPEDNSLIKYLLTKFGLSNLGSGRTRRAVTETPQRPASDVSGLSSSATRQTLYASSSEDVVLGKDSRLTVVSDDAEVFPRHTRVRRGFFDGFEYNTALSRMNNATLSFSPADIPLKFVGLLSSPAVRVILNHVVGPMNYTGDAPQKTSPSLISSTSSVLAKTFNVVEATCKGLEEAAQDPVLGHGIQCTLIYLITTLLACGADIVTPVPSCQNLGKIPNEYPKNCTISESDRLPIQIRRLPVSSENPLNETHPYALVKSERLTYLYLFLATKRANQLAHRIARCDTIPSFVSSSHETPDLVPGWDTVHIIKLREEGEKFVSPELKFDPAATVTDEVPFLFIARPRIPFETDVDQVLLVLRPTISMFEWKLDFRTNMVPLIPRIDPNILVHAGFASLVQSIGPSLLLQLTKFTASNLQNRKTEVIIAAHSLGAGVAQALAIWLRAHFPLDELIITAVLFAAPNALNAAGVRYYSENVNGRLLNHEDDAMTSSPCSVATLPSGFPRCGENGTPALVNTGTGVDFYFPLSGRYMIQNVVGPNNKVWIKMNSSLHIEVPYRKLDMYHVDAYQDWLQVACDT